MSAIIIDRRSNGRRKNSPNRQRFIKRIREVTASGIRKIVSQATIKSLSGDGDKVITVPASGIAEPRFVYGTNSGITDLVIPGNDRYRVDDKIPKPPSDQSSGEASSDGDGEDEFSFSLSREDFMDLLFDQCELPDLIKQQITKNPEQEKRRAGFSSDGPPSALNVTRSMRGAKSRKYGLGAAKIKKLKELESALEILLKTEDPTDAEQQAIADLQEQINALRLRINRIPFLDPIDLRYNAWDIIDVPSTQAVMVCLMDVSGSMDERKKSISKIFFLLLYLFLTRAYERVVIRFVTYHTTGSEVSEEDFWYGRVTGGTVTSAGLEVVRDILVNDYPTDSWNAYVAHASDGDNYLYDNALCKTILERDILPRVQYYAYLQAGDDTPYNDVMRLWSIFHPMSVDDASKVSAVKVAKENEVYAVFLKLFKKRAGA